MDQLINDVKNVVETWNVQKVTGRQFNRVDMYKFVETMNDRTRQVISLYRETNPIFYQELALIAGLAADIVSNLPYRADDPLALKGRTLVRTFEVNESDFYTGLQELCVNAATLTTPGARIFADGVDRTNL